MGLYAQQNLGDAMSQIVIFDDTQDEAIRSLERGNTLPTVLVTGLLHDSTSSTNIQNVDNPGTIVSIATHTEALIRYHGAGWNYLLDLRHPALNSGGTVKMGASLDLGGQKIVSLAAGMAIGDAIRKDQAVLVDGTQALTGDWSAGTNKITDLAAPTNPNDAARLADITGDVTRGRGALFQNLNAAEIFSKNPVGGPIGTITHRLNETDFRPRRADIAIKARMNDSTDFGTNGQIEAFLQVPAFLSQADNGGIYTLPIGWAKIWTGSSLEWAQLFADYAPGLVGPAGGAQVRSQAFKLSAIGQNMKLYVEFHDETFNEGGLVNASGVEIYVVRDDNGEYQEFDEFGGGGAGVLQLMVTGFDE
jgi:hypothetical protein